MDILLDDSGEIVFPSKWVLDKDRTKQAAIVLMRTWLGEFYMDPSIGIDYAVIGRDKEPDLRDLNEGVKKTMSSSEAFTFVTSSVEQVSRTIYVYVDISSDTTTGTLSVSNRKPAGSIPFGGYLININNIRSV
jgi:hypothetical protein